MNIVAFGAHPDDVELHAGGTLAKFAAAGHNVFGVIVTDMGDIRKVEARRGFDVLGLTAPYFLDIDKSDFMVNRKCLDRFDGIIRNLRPDRVFTHFHGDSHPDHQRVHKLTVAALRHSSIALLMYERAVPGALSPQTFRPQWFEKLTAMHVKLKLKALACHKSQNTGAWRHHVIGRSRYWGYYTLTGFAEAFEVIKYVD